MSNPDDNSFLTLFWVLDSACIFPTLNSPIHHLLQFFSSLSFILDVATTPSVLTTEHTELLY
jgi:hypothetical protein